MLSFIKYGSVCRPAAGFYLIQVPQEASRSAAAWAAKRHCRKNDVHKSTKKKKNTAVFVAGCRVRTHSTARYSQGLIQGYCNLSFVSQGNFGSMNASPAWGRCVTPQNESEEEKKNCTYAREQQWIDCWMEAVDDLSARLVHLSGPCSSCSPEQRKGMTRGAK